MNANFSGSIDARPQSVMESCFEALAQRQSETAALVSALADRLNSVLTPTGLGTADKAGKDAPAPARAPLHTDMLAAAHRQEVLNDGLKDLLDRLVVG